MSAGSQPWLRRAWPIVVVFGIVLGADLALVALAGTDIPFYDQWGIEGAWLYPKWLDGSLRGTDLLQAFNEHRIFWAHLLNLGLFNANGQWDPLVQLVAIAGLRAGCAATLVGWFDRESRLGTFGRIAAAAAIALAFLPQLAWHNVLWGFESQVTFALWFSWLTLALLSDRNAGWRRVAAGLLSGLAALLAMAPGALVPVALLGLFFIRQGESPGLRAGQWRQLWPAALLLLLAIVLRVTVPEHSALGAPSLRPFLAAAVTLLAWPNSGQALTALLMNLPLLVLIASRMLRRRRARPGEDFVLLLGGWSAAVAISAASARGGSPELSAGVPSRYADFLVLLPLANLWCAIVLAGEAAPRWRRSSRIVAIGWGAFLFIGWLGLSVEMTRRVILPRARDVNAPVRLMVAFQQTGDPAVFAGQPRLLVPHPNLQVVSSVLADPRMRGHFPPSLQPQQPEGPLSRAVRVLLRRD